MKKKYIKATISCYFVLICSLCLAFPAYAHSGRTDSSGGHHDYNNVSGLGDYHYHHGCPPHLHLDGVCPYGASNTETTISTPVPTPPPSPAISITNAPQQLNVGDSAGLNYTIENATDYGAAVTSADETIVRVNSDQTLSAVGSGITNITISGSGVSKTFQIQVNSVPVAQLSISDVPNELQLGNTVQLHAAILPENSTDKTITWTSSDPNVLKISKNGKIKAKSTGTASVICQAKNGVTTEATIQVFEIFPEKIRLNKKSLDLKCGETSEIKASILPKNANNKQISMEIEDDTIAEITDNTVHALKEGSTALVLTACNGLTKEIPITVYHIPVESLAIDDSQMSYLMADHVIDKDSTIFLNAIVTPSDATYPDVTWKSNRPEIVEVKNNQFIIHSTGEVTLTAHGHDSCIKEISLKIIDKPELFTAV